MSDRYDILAIDDEQVVVDGIRRICRSEGWSVDEAGGGAAGLARLAAGTHRLILCDIMMEGLDGFQFLDELARRQIPTPVVMTTGYATLEYAVRSLRCGAIGFMPKPFTADELLAIVTRGLACSTLRERARAEGRPLDDTRCPPHYLRLGPVSWALVEPEGTVRIGASDLFLRTLTDVTHAMLAPAGDELAHGTSCAALTTVDGLAHDLMAPVSGRILETNSRVASDPALLLRDPFGEGWLYRILPADLAYDLNFLAGPHAPEKQLKKEKQP